MGRPAETWKGQEKRGEDGRDPSLSKQFTVISHPDGVWKS